MNEAAQQQALYLYCLTYAEQSGAPACGLDEAGCIFSLESGPIAALLSRVPIDDFCGPTGDQNLQDPGWLCERAVQHQRVVVQVARLGPVLPARFGTLFSTDHALRRFVDLNREAIVRFFESVRDHEEWGIKARLERTKAKRWLAAGMANVEDVHILSPGLRYIREKQAQATAEKELRQWLSSYCDKVARELQEHASDLRQRAIVDDRVAGDSLETVLNFAVLIRRDRLQGLRVRIHEINADCTASGLSFVLNGPWPPYSFCPSLETRP